jgi:hypothetical protein
MPPKPFEPPIKDDQPHPVAPGNDDPGTPGPFTVGGMEITGLVSTDANGATVTLEDGATAYIPATAPEHAEAIELPPVDAPPPTVPQSVDNARFRAALRNAGLFDTAQAAIDNMNEPDVTNAWEYSPYIDRVSVLTTGLGSTLGLTDAELDQLFIDASVIEL